MTVRGYNKEFRTMANRSQVIRYTILALLIGTMTSGCTAKNESGRAKCLPFESNAMVYAATKNNEEPVVAIEANEFNRALLESPKVDGEVHIADRSRYVLMAKPSGSSTLISVREVALDYTRSNQPDLAFIASPRTSMTVTADNQTATVAAQGANAVDVIELALNKGYVGKQTWKSITCKELDVNNITVETAIAIDGKRYVLAFAEKENDAGTLLVDLENDYKCQFIPLTRSQPRKLRGNAMYVNHYDNKVTVNIYDQYLTIEP